MRIATAQTIEQFSVPVDYRGATVQLKAELQKPTGSGPFPVVIALHGCLGFNGVRGAWLPLLQQQGYAVLRLDSFTARGHDAGICNDTEALNGVDRATDALAAAYVVAARTDIRRDRIAIIGWSHGGRGAAAVTKDGPDQLIARRKLASRGGKLVASVDLYGSCGGAVNPVVMPLLVLLGADDDWTSNTSCLELSKVAPALVTVRIYPGASHAFDEPGEPHEFYGHLVRYDAAATADAQARVAEFLRRYMQ